MNIIRTAAAAACDPDEPNRLVGGICKLNEEFGLGQSMPSLQEFTLETLLGRSLNVVLGLLAVSALVVVLYGGFIYLTSLGDEQKASQAKKILLWAIIGLLVVGVAWSLVAMIGRLFEPGP
jgi:hypothetical protein